jgi:type I restriction enzyme S subunit
MDEWSIKTLKEISTNINYGYTASATDVDTGIKFLRITDIVNQPFDWSSVPYCEITSKDAEKYKLGKGDIVIARTGATTGTTFIFEDNIKAVFASYLIRYALVPKLANPKFISYQLKSDNWKGFVENIIGGSAQPGANAQQFATFELSLPALPEQEAIAEVLSSLDDKIELLHRNNKTLEEFAEVIFQKYFQNTDWMISILDEVAIVQNGCSFKSSEFVDIPFETYEVFKMGHIDANGGLRSAPKKDYVIKSEKLKRWVLNKRDIVLAMTDMKDNVVILGVPALIDLSNHYALNQRVARIYLKDDSPLIDPLLLYFQMRDKNFIATLQSKANSGVQVNLTTDAIKNSEIIVPPAEVQKEILLYLGSIQDKIELNRIQIHHLENLRNTLLPKLMSGAVRVNI